MTTIRPEFEPDDEEESAPPPRAAASTLLAWLRLMRLPNVFTAVADVAMGYLFVQASFDSPAKLACLIAASALLYTAGMVLNDVFDFEIDARERPFRPLPSGQISLGAARLFGFTLLAAGVGLGWAGGYVEPGAAAIPWRSGLIASALAGCVLFYNLWLKRTPLGPLGMGACRFLNVLLGMSAASAIAPGALALGFTTAELLTAGGIGVYIVGVTLFARGEATSSRAAVLYAAIGVMIGGAALLGYAATHHAGLDEGTLHRFWMLLGLLMFIVVRRCGSAALNPTPELVQLAVKNCILSIIWLDAATAATVAPTPYAVAIAALLIPAIVLGWWVYST